MTSTSSKNIRLTISVSPEVHATFQRLSKAANMSISKAMGEWLGDTVEAAEFMTQAMEKARAAPKLVMQEMHAYALGLADETGDLLERIRKKGQQPPQVERSAGAAAAPSPRLVIRGGKSTVEKPASRAKKVVSPMKFPLPPAKVQAYAGTNGKPPKASK